MPSKILAFPAIVALSLQSLKSSRTIGLAYGLLIGISSLWCILLSVNLLFLNKSTEDFERKIACSSMSTEKQGARPGAGIGKETQWQGMPSSIPGKLFWILDLLGSLRGLQWSYKSSTDGRSMASCSIPEDTSSISRRMAKLLLIYLCIDCLKEVIAMGPYFWGYIDYDTPYYINSYSFVVGSIQIYRMLIAFAVVYVSIELISTLGVLILLIS